MKIVVLGFGEDEMEKYKMIQMRPRVVYVQLMVVEVLVF